MNDFDFDAAAAEFDGNENIAQLQKALVAAEAAAKGAGKDRVAYVATVDCVAHFEVTVSGKVVLKATVNENVEAPMPDGVAAPDGTKCHVIMIGTPDGSVIFPTNGRTFTLPSRPHSEGSVVRAYVLKRISRFLVQAYNLGI